MLFLDDIITIENFDHILLHKKPYGYIFTYNISKKTFIGSKLLRIRFDKADGFIGVYDGTRYLIIFDPEKRWCRLQ